MVLGTAQFGLDYGIANANGKIKTKEIEDILLYSKLHQINTIDTAISYGDSEACMGAIGVNDWNIITKLPEVPETCKEIHGWISRNIQESLSRLNITKLDAILLHNPMQLLGEGGVEIWSSLRHNQSLGIVDKIGFSIYDPSELDELYFKFKPDLVQFPYNVFDRRIENSGWLERLNDDKVETHARSVFLQGLLLFNKEKRPAKFKRWSRLWLLWDEWLDNNNITARQACINFVLLNKNINKVVVGVDNIDQIKEVLSTVVDPIAIPDNFGLLDYDLINPSNWGKL